MGFGMLTRKHTKATVASEAISRLIDIGDLWIPLQGWLAHYWAQEIFKQWLDQAHISGALELPRYWRWRDRYHRSACWGFRGWNLMQPHKDWPAILRMLCARLVSPQYVSRRYFGRPWREVLQEWKTAEAIAREEGIEVDQS